MEGFILAVTVAATWLTMMNLSPSNAARIHMMNGADGESVGTSYGANCWLKMLSLLFIENVYESDQEYQIIIVFITEAFHCRNGSAYLFNTVVNVSVGPQEERMMTTGMHMVADIFCNCCGQIVGWKYESAHEKSQKYKEGKFILERAKVMDFDGTNFYLDSHQAGSDVDDA